MLVKITLLIGVMYLIWHALYLRVVADENPSALDSKELQEIVRREATIDSNLPAMNSQCLRVELTGPSPEIMGIDGIAFKKIPGQYDITLLLKTEFEKQPKRDRQLWQLDYLAEQGIFDAYNGTVESTNGERAVRRYRLTWPGAVIMGRRGGSTTVCLEYGRVTYGEIKNIEKLQEKHKTGDIYKVTYTLKLVDIPGWAKNEKALKLFDRLAEALKDKVRVTKVLKTNDGWQLLKERQPARAVSGFGHITIPIDIKSIDKEIEVPSVEAINAYIDENARSIDWLVKYEKTCMPVWIHVGDDKSTQTDKEFSVTYYDLKDRKQYEFQKIVNSLHLLTALERAGLAELEYISQQANSSISTHEPGVRFRVKRQAIEAIDLHKQGKGCIPYGRQSVEILSVKADKGMNRMGYHFTAKKIVEEVPVWVKKIAKELPALESVIEHGVLMRGYLFNNSYNKKYWEIQNADYIYPRINHNSLPSYLEPVLRNTALAMPAKKVIAPIVPANDSGSEYEPPNSSVINKPVKKSKIKSMGSQFQVKQIQDNASLENSSVSKTSLYSVGDSDVHVIAIYEGSGRHGGPRKWAEDVVGQVSLTVRVIDSVLLLYAYKPTSWNLKVYDGYAIKKVIVAGSKNQQVNVSGQVKPKVIAIDNRKLMSSIDVGRYSRFPTGHSKNELLDAALITSAVTGKAPTTYQAFYKAPKGGFYISDSTPVFRPPLPIKPSDYPKNTKISMQSGQLLYWSDREFSSGKLYTEMRLRVINALYAPKRSNLGLCLSKTKGVVGSDKGSAKLMIQGEQSLRKDGDVFGIAADFDNQRIYYHVNGNWVTGKPGSGDGVKLEKDKFYRICATSSFRAIKEFRSSIDLVINSSIKQYTKMSIQGM
ncbi:MAG: hypothetical protein ABW098_03760 [Candidatus Thiodiazotropha sp.]